MKNIEEYNLYYRNYYQKNKTERKKYNKEYRNKPVKYDTYAQQIEYADSVRRNKQNLNILEVKCTYCGKWFIPTLHEIVSRINALNGKLLGEHRLYCSDNCKKECPIFRQQIRAKDEINKNSNTSREVQPELRQMRFELDNYICQKCNKHQDELEVGLQCHHLEGILWEPLESADIDKCITYCKNCHKKVHKIEGCKYYEMKCKKVEVVK